MIGVLVTGGNGLLGSKLIRQAPADRKIIALDIHDKPAVTGPAFVYEQCDITSREQVNSVFNTYRPDAVLHAAAFTNVDKCETEQQRAWDVNVRGTEHIAESAGKYSARLIHLSTDYVFDGREGPYHEEDTPNPLSHYGLTKLESEKIVFSVLENAAIARTMVLYGIESHIRKNFVTWLAGKLAAHETVDIVSDQYGNPTLADDLAGVLWSLLDSNSRGIYHTAGRDWLNRFDFAKAVAECFDLDADLIRETTSDRFIQAAKRPLRSGLICDKLKRELGITMKSVSEGIEIVRRQMELL